MSEMNPNPRSGMSSAMVPCIVMPPGLRVDAAGGVPSWACAGHGTPSAGTRGRRKHVHMDTSSTQTRTQFTEGQGKQPEHTHSALTHTHDHYHVSHRHSDNPLN